MNSQNFKEMYEAAKAKGLNGTAVMNFGAQSISDGATGRAWMTYEETRQGVGFMGQPQTHEVAAAAVTKYHKGF